MPDRAARVMAAVRQMRGGRDYESGFGARMRGRGPYADLLERRFALARRRAGYPAQPLAGLDCSRFVPPLAAPAQRELF